VFARIATVELSLMTAALGLAVVLGRTAPPIAASVRAVPPHAAAFPTVDPTLSPLRPLSALLETRPDALVATFLVAAAALLVAWVRRGPADGRPTLSQGLCLAAGIGLAAWALVGGLGAYSTALLSAQVAQVLVLMVLVPTLMARGLPSPRLAALVDHGRRRRLGLVLLQPTNAAVLAVLVLAATFQTPLLDASLGSELGHLLVGLAALVSGSAVIVPLVAERSRPARPVAGLLLVAGVLAWYGGRMRLTTVPMAGGWFRDLDLWWIGAEVDQRAAGAVALVFAAGLVVLAAVLRRPTLSGSRARPAR
jgi:putative copper resistance protein D